MADQSLAAGSSQPLTKHVSGDGTSTLTYTLPAGVYQYVQSVNAVIDTSASGDVSPTLTVREADQTVIADALQDDAIEGGGSGRATWALRLTASTAGNIRYKRLNSGEWFSLTTTGTGPSGDGTAFTTRRNFSINFSAAGGVPGFYIRDHNGATLLEIDENGFFLWDNGAFQVNTQGGAFQVDSSGGGGEFVNGPFNVEANGGRITLNPQTGELMLASVPADKVGFFGVGPVTQRATPVTLGDVIALLQAYGLAA